MLPLEDALVGTGVGELVTLATLDTDGEDAVDPIVEGNSVVAVAALDSIVEGNGVVAVATVDSIAEGDGVVAVSPSI